MRDVKLVCRSLIRAPAFTLAAVLALGLSIGAATTVFSVADGALFRPLPYHDASRLVAVSATVRARGFNSNTTPVELDAWRAASPSVADLASHAPGDRLTIDRPDEPREVVAARVTPNFLTVLGVAPVLGRDFTMADAAPGAARALLLTDGVWRRVFNSDASIVGQSIMASGAPAHVAGVLPRDFVFPSAVSRTRPDVLLVLAPADTDVGARAIARLTRGATLERAEIELDAIAASRKPASDLRNTVIDGATVQPLPASLAASSQRVMVLLMCGVGSLLLIGCANVANLLLARGVDRRGELALRSALGASRATLVRLQLIEGAVLALAGGAVGALLASWGISAVAPLVPDDLKTLKPIVVDGRALVFAAAVSLLTVVLAALFPALRATRGDLVAAVGQVASRRAGGRLRTHRVIVGLEVALATVLLVAGGLMAHAMLKLLRVDHGYAAARVLTMRVQLPRATKPLPRSIPFVARTLEAARRTGGVIAAGAMEGSPLDRTMYGGSYMVEGFSNDWMRQDAGISGSGVCCTQTHRVSSEYFTTLGVPVIRGRAFLAADATAAPKVAVISDRLARKFPAGTDPIGAWLVGSDAADRRLIVGVVGDVRDMSLEYGTPQTIYLPLEERGATGMTLMVRTAGDPMDVATPLRRSLQADAGPLVVERVGLLDDLILRSVSARQLNAWLFGAFGAIGLLLAATGIFGVISYAVARRTPEIGVRLALGASPGGVRRLMVRQAFVPVATGLAIGLGLALWLGRFLASLLYEVTPTDVTTYVAVAAVLSLSALVAALVPARRAARVNPIVALRVD
jgi:predicted permease